MTYIYTYTHTYIYIYINFKSSHIKLQIKSSKHQNIRGHNFKSKFYEKMNRKLKTKDLVKTIKTEEIKLNQI